MPLFCVPFRLPSANSALYRRPSHNVAPFIGAKRRHQTGAPRGTVSRANIRKYVIFANKSAHVRDLLHHRYRQFQCVMPIVRTHIQRNAYFRTLPKLQH